MIVTNHFLAGVVIAGAVSNPIVGLPLALSSHIALDALPHHGFKKSGLAFAFKQRQFLPVILFTIGTCIWACLAVTSMDGLLSYSMLAGVVAASPDLLSFMQFLFVERKKKPLKLTVFGKLHRSVQWWERPIGFVFELGMLALLAMLVFS